MQSPTTKNTYPIYDRKLLATVLVYKRIEDSLDG